MLNSTPKREFSEIVEAAEILEQNKAENIALLDLTEIHGYLDYFIIATALSSMHLKKLADDTLRYFKQQNLSARYPTTTDLQSGWVILDLHDFIVHLFLKETREYYNLETLWNDAKPISW